MKKISKKNLLNKYRKKKVIKKRKTIKNKQFGRGWGLFPLPGLKKNNKQRKNIQTGGWGQEIPRYLM